MKRDKYCRGTWCRYNGNNQDQSLRRWRAYQIDGKEKERRRKMSRQMYNVKDVQEILGVGESKAYQFIRIMNEELREKGFLTVQGKVPAAYMQERFYGMVAVNK